jgi:DEAD/DEAH box helicase domain-containing protein
MLQDLFRTLGFRISLESIAKATLGAAKTADGLQSVQWFREGKLEQVAEYCKADVDLTRRIYEFGRQNGYIHYYSKLGSKLKVAVNWK